MSSHETLEGEESLLKKIYVKMQMQHETPEPVYSARTKVAPEWNLIVMFDGNTLLNTKWKNGKEVTTELAVNLLDVKYQQLIAEKPLILLLRTSGGKLGKDPDPLTHVDNRAGGTVDLLPLAFGNDVVRVKVRLVTPTGDEFGCKVKVEATTVGPSVEQNLIPFVLTMVSIHCLPVAKNDTVYVAALGLDRVLDKPAVNFNMSLSNANAQKCLWSSACTGGLMTSTLYFAPDQDMYIPKDVHIDTDENCISFYWNSVKRVLVDMEKLKNRLKIPLRIEVAGVGRLGKTDIRGRYMGIVDAKVLLHPNQNSLLTCAKLSYFVEAELPEGAHNLLEIPSQSARASARGPLICVDRDGHTPYVVIKLDLAEPLVPNPKLSTYFDTIGFNPPEKPAPLNELYLEPPPDDSFTVDVRKIRRECGALAVHKELSNIACRGLVPMNQSIKRSAANKLITRVRAMLKQFPPGECSYLEWQETVTGQHAASRRAVTASFRPQPPPKHPTLPHMAARARMAGDQRLASYHIEYNLQVAGKHPRSLLSKALRCLEARLESKAINFLVSAIQSQPRNRYLLWVFGAMEFNKGPEKLNTALAAFRIAVKGDHSDGPACTIGWAALHALYHYDCDPYGEFVAATRMRKSHELERDWTGFYKRWLATSGEEEVLWDPLIIMTENPLLMAAAFFLCLRCYKFCEVLLNCLELGCATRGSRLGLQTKITKDVYYLRAVSLLLRRYGDEAMKTIDASIRRYGPVAMLLQLRASCLLATRGWDEECAAAVAAAEGAGAVVSNALLLQGALHGMKDDPEGSLQRAARVHRTVPCAYSALVLSQVWARCGDEPAAERWAAVAVRLEPQLADGWAMLALLALKAREVPRARALLRTAQQVGPIDENIERRLKKIMKIIKIDSLADLMSKNLCFCEYFDSSEIHGAQMTSADGCKCYGTCHKK